MLQQFRALGYIIGVTGVALEPKSRSNPLLSVMYRISIHPFARRDTYNDTREGREDNAPSTVEKSILCTRWFQREQELFGFYILRPA